MDMQRFDALTRRVGSAGSRRRVLSALVVGAAAHLAQRSDAVACKGHNAKCKSNGSCCGDAGLRCVKQGKKKKKRCRCIPGWARCPESGDGCLHVAEDTENCGSCGNECPDGEPCCFGGECQPLCDGACCADCFVEVQLDGTLDLDNPVCCAANGQASGGTICSSNKKKTSDDRCCWPFEACVNGKCCCDDCAGSVVCGGKCCAKAACCNGVCCKKGKVCATTDDGDTCVPANRACGGANPPCFASETCIGGHCCPAARTCGNICCAADEYCEIPGHPSGGCCPINSTCNGSYRGHRIRR